MCDRRSSQSRRELKTSLVEMERSVMTPLVGGGGDRCASHAIAKCAEERWQPYHQAKAIKTLMKTDANGDNLPMRQAAQNNREGLLESLAYFVGYQGPAKKAFVHQVNSSGHERIQIF